MKIIKRFWGQNIIFKNIKRWKLQICPKYKKEYNLLLDLNNLKIVNIN